MTAAVQMLKVTGTAYQRKEKKMMREKSGRAREREDEWRIVRDDRVI